MGDDESGGEESGESYVRLRNVRAGNRAVVTRIEREAIELIDSKDEYDEAEILHLKVKLSTLEDKLIQLPRLDQDILRVVDPNEIVNEIEQASEIELRLKEAIVKIKRVIDKYQTLETGSVISNVSRRTRTSPANSQQSNTRPSSPAASDGGQSVQSRIPSEGSHTSRNGNSFAKVKLPKIPLPRFNGDITKFFTFWDSFESMVDMNEDLSSIDKFNYLQRALDGTAARALEGLPLRDRTYVSAVNLLKERFGNKQKIISAHMEGLLDLKSCEKEDPTQLRKIYDKINIQIRGLEALDVTSDTYGVLLVPVIMSRLPSQIRLQITRQTTQELWSLAELMELLRKEVEARELNHDIALKEKGRLNTGRREGQGGVTPSASALTSFGENKGNWPNCVFCKGNHFSSSCRKVSSIKDRSDQLLREKRCFRCLRGGHFVRECRGRKCRKCDGNHHQSLCEKEMAGGNEAKREDRTKKDAGDTDKQENQSITATNKKHKPGILLQTARTYAFKDDQDAKVPIRILFDSGSQLSYVSENLREKLDLRPIGNEVININTFGTEKYRKHNCAHIEVSIETAGNNHVKIKALSYPTICSPVKSNVKIESFEHLLGLELADDPCRVDSEDESIDILIGLNYYYDFVIGDVIRGKSGPVAVRSKVGWLISGSAEANTETDFHVYTSSNLIIEGDHVESESKQNDELLETFRKVFEVEPIGSGKDLEVEKVEFIKTCDVKFNGERYEVSLPWRKDITEPLGHIK